MRERLGWMGEMGEGDRGTKSLSQYKLVTGIKVQHRE